MTNQPLFLRNNPPAVEPVLHGARGSEEPERLRGRKGADGRRVCLQLGCIFYFFIFIGGDRKQTTQSIIHQRAQCSNSVAYVSFVRIPKRWRLSCLSHQIWSWSNNIMCNWKQKKEKPLIRYRPRCRQGGGVEKGAKKKKKRKKPGGINSPLQMWIKNSFSGCYDNKSSFGLQLFWWEAMLNVTAY